MSETTTEEIPWCCGADVIVRFGYDPMDTIYHYGSEPTQHKPSVKDVKKALADAIKQDGAFKLAFLTVVQNKKFGKVLKDAGFKLVSRGINTNNDNAVLYCYIYTNRKKARVQKDPGYLHMW